MNLAAFTAALRGDIVNATVAGTPGGIERQEAAGQQMLLESAVLPKEIRGATREQLEALGFKFLADVDDLFVTCELPAGWTKRGTSHSMHSDLLDELGRKRAGIFYKAAFYDRRADMIVDRRYRIDCYCDGSSDKMRRVDVTDFGAVIKEFGEFKRGDLVAEDALHKSAESWLDDHHPDWRSSLS
jgi:hypothetical protein